MDKYTARFHIWKKFTPELPKDYFYILPDGDILDLGQDGNKYISDLLSREGIEDRKEIYSNVLRDSGWIWGNVNLSFMNICKEVPSQEQFYKIHKLVEKMSSIITINTPDNQINQFSNKDPWFLERSMRDYYMSSISKLFNKEERDEFFKKRKEE